MARSQQLYFPPQEINPARSKPRSREEISAEIARVDEAIDQLSIDAPRTWRVLGEVSVPVALRSLKHYRQRLARAGR